MKKLVAAAREAERRNDLKKALSCYLALELEEPDSPVWAREVARLYGARGEHALAAAAMFRSAARYAQDGLALKAIVALKTLLEADPNHREAQQLLLDLQRAARERRPSPGTRPRNPLARLPSNATTPYAVLPVLPFLRSVAPPPAGGGMAPSMRAFELLEGPSDLEIAGADTLLGAPEDSSDGLSALRILPPIPLFGSLSELAFQELLDRARIVELEPGAILFRQGDLGEALYVIIDGAVDVIAETEPRTVVGHLDDGAFFGEIALFADRPRSATIQAAQKTTLLEITRLVLTDLVNREPEVLDVLMRFFRDRLVSLLTREHPLFARLPPGERRTLVDRFQLVDADAGAILIREGEPSPGLFMLLDGTLKVVRGNDELVALLLEPGHVVGEISLVTGQPAVASVVATVKSVVLKLPAERFHAATIAHPELARYASELANERLAELGLDTHLRLELL